MDSAKRGHEAVSPSSNPDSPPYQKSRWSDQLGSPILLKSQDQQEKSAILEYVNELSPHPQQNRDYSKKASENCYKIVANCDKSSEMAGSETGHVKSLLQDNSAPDYFNKAMGHIETLLAPLSKIDNIFRLVTELKKSVDAAHTVAEEAKSEAEKLSHRVAELESDLGKSQSEQTNLKIDLKNMNDRLIQQEDYSRRENLIFEGIDHSGNNENVEQVLKSTLSSMGLANLNLMKFDRVHRMNTKKVPKPIIARFQWYQDRQKVWDLRKEDLRKYNDATGKKVSMREDFCSDTLEKRRKLYPIMKAARRDPSIESAYISYDKLVIDKRVYRVDTLHTLPPALQPENLSEKENGSALVFWGENSMLSNFYRAPFMLEGITYNCVEQYLCSSKALIFGDQESRAAIMREKNPAKQKAMGRKVKGFNSKIWGESMLGFAEEAIRAKIDQNRVIYDKLISTRGKALGEASSSDSIWGTGKGILDEETLDTSKWSGKNLLGQLLVRIRDDQ